MDYSTKWISSTAAAIRYTQRARVHTEVLRRMECELATDLDTGVLCHALNSLVFCVC